MLLDCFGIKDVAKINSQALQKSVFTAHPQSGSWGLLKPQSIKNWLMPPAQSKIQTAELAYAIREKLTTRQRLCTVFLQQKENQHCD